MDEVKRSEIKWLKSRTFLKQHFAFKTLFDIFLCNFGGRGGQEDDLKNGHCKV